MTRSTRCYPRSQIARRADALLKSIAVMTGCTPRTLRKWVQRADIDGGQRPGQTSAESEELKALPRERRELKRAERLSERRRLFSIGRS